MKNKKMKKINELNSTYLKYADEIIKKENMQKMKNYIQHGDTDCYMHSLIVAYISLQIARKFNISCDERSMVRGALLHDYFLYDWHNPHVKVKGLHGFSHPKTALKNAEKEFKLNDIERNIIKRHMFPLTIVPPKYKESVIVSIADKISSVAETLKIAKKHRERIRNLIRIKELEMI